MDKFLISFDIPPEHAGEFRDVMNRISAITGLEPPYNKLPPHVSFHRPIIGIGERTIKNLMMSAALQMRCTRMTLGGLTPFGKEYIVMPVHATMSLAALWVEVNDLLARLPEYAPGPYDGENTLHVTVADNMHRIFDRYWRYIRAIEPPVMAVPVEAITLYKKPDGQRWWNPVISVPLSR